jgi:hypothetical protein
MVFPMNIDQLKEIIEYSPAIRMVRAKNAPLIASFLFLAFKQENKFSVPEDRLLDKLADYLRYIEFVADDEYEILASDDYLDKARKLVQKWTDFEYLRNYHDEDGAVVYELTSSSEKALDWICSLEKKEFVGTESKFKSIFSKLKELVEYSTVDKEQRLQELEQRKADLEAEIRRIKVTGQVEVFDDFQIRSRVNELTQTAKELLADFREVEENFKNITRRIYQQHTDPSQTKGGILAFAFDALDELKESDQGKSFYAFWEFLIIKSRQDEWKELTDQLFALLDGRHIAYEDAFLRKMKTYLHRYAQRVYESNDRMAEKLSRVILENERYEGRQIKETIGTIKEAILKIANQALTPDFGLIVERAPRVNLYLERKISFEKPELPEFTTQPTQSDATIADLTGLTDIYGQHYIDRRKLERRIARLLAKQSQVSLKEITTEFPVEKGLAEIIGYLTIAKDRPEKALINGKVFEEIHFDRLSRKMIKVPQIIYTR